MADTCRNPPLSLHSPEPRQTPRSRMSRTAREPLHQIILPGNMGYDSLGCWVLDSHADTKEVVERHSQYGLYWVLSHRC